MQNVQGSYDRFPLDRQLILAGIVLPFICWLVFCWIVWPGNSRRTVPPWHLIVPLGLFISLAATILISSAHLAPTTRKAQALIGAMWAGALLALTLGAFTGFLSGSGLTKITMEIFGFAERPVYPMEGIEYQTNYTDLYMKQIFICILGFVPLWSAYAVSRRAFQLTKRMRKDNEFWTGIATMIGGAALLLATVALMFTIPFWLLK